ncbi:hypothetical protein SS1G_06928 [Sclerotinia sclerotiorum 1980 UF-70]|uniref:Uncharacterized protein n=1 Tax=Sclerotinia sclerotiorum (strain ATCC 18683 / 1980 / Ss-1) TaxID=665079 RepID=A7ENM9_SCLS1|nr:hypothetical protein SS1G_06928 [Sclerotinia sclerotiorum 1980 UF-70]EDO04445.1 hypothetical protein SS1G_06928 [Sclerotinia sclerotiorum 1980 UF-70]
MLEGQELFGLTKCRKCLKCLNVMCEDFEISKMQEKLAIM